MRAAAGLGGTWLPTGPAEKIICLKNQNDLGLINGMFVTLEDIVDEGSLYFSAVVHDEGGRHIGEPYEDGRPGRLRIYKGHFEDHVAYDDKRHDRDYKEKRLLTEATFGWAITAHKAQGSQWGERDRLGRRAGPQRDRPAPLALHRDHPGRARARPSGLRGAMIDLNDIAVPKTRHDLAAVKERLACTAADWLPGLFPPRPGLRVTAVPCAARTSPVDRRARMAPAPSISTGPMPAGASTTPPASGPVPST